MAIVELDLVGWSVVAVCAVIVGISKTGVPGIGIVVVPLMASILPTRSSVGVLLGILILGDVFAAGYYRRHAQWGHILKLLPIAFVGIIVGYFGLKVVNDEQLRPIIGVIVLAMLGINYWRRLAEDGEKSIPKGWWFPLLMGFFAGVTTMMANAAGPIMIIYLLAMRLPKKEFVGTAAWFFFVINWVKVPLGLQLGLITFESVKLNLLMLPFVIIGAVAGIVMLRKIPQKAFSTTMEILAAAAALKLLLSAFGF